MSWVATAVVASSIYSANRAGDAQSESSAEIAASTDRATAETSRQFDVAQENLAPYREIGAEAVDVLRNSMVNGEFNDFYESPDYQFTLQEGQKAVDRAQSASGSRYGGRAIKEAINYNQGAASTQYGNWWNRVFNIANMGQSAAAGTANAAIQTGQTNAGILTSAGTNQANITMQGAANQNAAIQGGIGNLTTLAAYNRMFPTGG